MLTLLVGVGIYLTVGLQAITWRRLAYSLRLLWQSRSSAPDDKGDITSFQALMTALSATVGSGNIAGVALAIHGYRGASTHESIPITSCSMPAVTR